MFAPSVGTMMNGEHAFATSGGTAWRRRQRRLRAFRRYVLRHSKMEIAAALHHTSGLRTSSTAAATQSVNFASVPAAVVGSLLPCEVSAAPVFDQVRQEQLAAGEIPENMVDIPVVHEQVFVQASPRVVGSLPPYEVVAAPVFDQVHQEQLAAGVIPENMLEIPVVREQVIVQAVPRVVGSLPPVAEVSEPVYFPFHQEQFSAGETTENIAKIPVVQEQVLVQAIPRFVGSPSPVQEFTAYVARRPPPLVEVRPSVRAQRHVVEQLADIAPMVQILDSPVSQTSEQLLEVFRLLDTQMPVEQAIAVPKITKDLIQPRLVDCDQRYPQMAEQLVEVPTVLTPTRIALQIAEQIVDTPVPRGRVHGSLPGQSSATSLPDSIEWVELSDANGRPYFWNRRSQATVRKAPPGVQVVWVGVKDEEGGTWYWHRRTRATGYSLPPLPPG